MKILYGIQGTGNGHLARARALVPELKAAGIDLDFVLSGRAREDYFNMEIFGDFKCFRGLSLITEKGQLKTVKTVTQNNLFKVFKDAKALDLSPYDLVISDFEPVTAWAAKIQKKPSIAISHQAAFRQAVPKPSGYLEAKLLMKIFAPTQYHLGLHWYPFADHVLPPLIDPMTVHPSKPNKVLVYMGFETVGDIIELLMPFTNYNFHVFAKVEKAATLGHIHVEPLSHTKFHEDMKDSIGIISNAGFELASEALSLGKKLLIKPLQGQYEQIANAVALEQMQRGTVMNTLDPKAVEKWLPEPAPEPLCYPNVAKAISQWLLNGQWHDDKALVKELWEPMQDSLPPLKS